jgi:hypothetical protein
MVAKFLRHAFGAATRAESAHGRSDGLPDLARAGLLTALQRRYEQGIGPDGTAAGLLCRWPHREPPSMGGYLGHLMGSVLALSVQSIPAGV